jgi:parallel beta-helix repeat protein
MDATCMPTFSGNTASGNGEDGLGVHGIVTHSGTWSANLPFIAVGDVTVPDTSTLTIVPGVLVKFNFGTTFKIKGTLLAEGTSTDSIVFTSSQAIPGDWYGLDFYTGSSNSVLDYCVVEHGAKGGWQNIRVGQDGSASPSITNSTIRHSARYGIQIWKGSSPTITGNTITGNASHGILIENSSNPTITDNTITNDSSYAIYMDATCMPTFSGNTASGNGEDGIGVHGIVTHSGTWSANLPFIATGDVTVPDTSTLTIVPGVLVKFNFGTTFKIEGTLLAEGTATDSIVFTSSRAIPGDWYGLDFYTGSSNSILDYCVVEHGGKSGWQNIRVGQDGSASPSITNSTIRHSARYGIQIWKGSSPTITGNTITGNADVGIYCSDSSTPAINYNNIMGNSKYGVYNLDSRVIVNARNNWWGDSTGPFHPDSNSSGLGDTVGDYVDFYPWADEPFYGVSEDSDISFVPAKSVLFAGIPNPFVSRVTLHYGLPVSSDVSLKIYACTGRLIRTLVNTRKEAGNHKVNWNGRDERNHRVGTGIYFYRLETVDFKSTKKLMLIE